MIDMHAHILFGVDDGPSTEEESLQMLKQAIKEGITGIISTSHAQKYQYNVDFSTVDDQIIWLGKVIEQNNLPLKVYSGHEIHINNQINTLLDNKNLHVLANSKYVLIELPSFTVPPYTKDMIIALNTSGYKPIIAHPERNRAIAENPSRLELLIREGAFAQITAGSLTGHFGKNVQKLALNLVRANYVHTYGSDAHNLTTRPFLFNEGLNYLEKKKELDAVDILLENNTRIIDDQPFIVLEPEGVIKQKWWKSY